MSAVQPEPAEFTRGCAERYDREAADYKELWAPILRQAGRRLLEELGDGAERVLDLGCGVGTLLPDLRDRFPRAIVIGIDRSPGMLAMAPATFPRAVMDATRLAIGARAVDRVVAAFMLFHLPSPADGVAEARRVLRPGGELGSITWAGELESKAASIWIACLDAHGAAPLDPANAARHDPVDTAAKMEALFEAAGFADGRAWEEDLVVTIDREHLLSLRTRLGTIKLRFDSLSPGARASCLAEARDAMSRLAPEDFVSRAKLVYALARA